MPDELKFFLADVVNEATLTPTLIEEACQTLRNNQNRFLEFRKAAWMAGLIASLAEDWLDSTYSFRNEVLTQGPQILGMNPEALEISLNHFWEGLTVDRLRKFLKAELGDAESLDAFRNVGGGSGSGSLAGRMAEGPEFIYHYTLDYNPCMTLSRMVHALLLKSSYFLRTLPGQAWLPLKFAQSLYQREPKIAACLEIAEWNRKTDHAAEMESILLREADVVWGLGNASKAEEICKQLGPDKKFLSWEQPVSMVWIPKAALDGFELNSTLENLVKDICAWNQFGPFAPDVVYVETRGPVTPEEFAVKLAAALDKAEFTRPRGKLSAYHEKQIQSRRDFYRIRCERLCDAKMFESPESTSWTVIFEEDLQLQTSCGGRFIYVKPVVDSEDFFRICEPKRRHIGAVALAGSGEELSGLARRFAKWGIPRICSLGSLQEPPIGAVLGGQRPLASSLRWSEWEESFD